MSEDRPYISLEEIKAKRERGHAGTKAKSKSKATKPIGEEAMALLFAERFEGRFVYDHTRGEWYRWTGQTWIRDSTEYVFDCVRALSRECGETRIKVASAIERAARADPRLARDHEAWNADPLLLGTPAGVVDMRTGKFLPADPKHMINMQTAASPAPAGTPCPLWMRFLDEATQGDRDLERFLAQRAGYWLTGSVHLEAFDFLFGGGGNGKGTFTRTLTRLMGDYARSAPIGMFMTRKFEGHPTEFARLADARLVSATETEKKRTWALSLIKQLTGNETKIPARFIGGNFFEYDARFKLLFVGNQKPKIDKIDRAIERRLNLIPFTASFDQRADTTLKERLEIEYPAILRWAIDGWLDLQTNGALRPEIIAMATRAYLDDENTLENWIAERCEIDHRNKELLKNLYADWKAWCERNQEFPGSNRGLKADLLERDGIGKRQDLYGVWLLGIALKGT